MLETGFAFKRIAMEVVLTNMDIDAYLLPHGRLKQALLSSGVYDFHACCYSRLELYTAVMTVVNELGNNETVYFN